MTDKNIKIMFIAGENSGDSHAASLAEALREKSPQTKFEFFGATGEKMRKAGIETIVKSDEFGIVGVSEVARALPMFWKVFKKLRKVAEERKPDAVVLIDFPDFNLTFAKSMKKRGLKVVYYISPQLWAWRQYRVKTIKKHVDLLLTILPFEKNWYAARGINHVEYVGHPLAGVVESKMTRREFCKKYKLDFDKPIIALLAGSRRKEVERILPLAIETAALMSSKNKDLQFVNALASKQKRTQVDEIIKAFKAKGILIPKNLITVEGETFEALNASDAAAVTSGTATLETAIIGTPLVVIYKTSRINYKLIRPLIDLDIFGLVNLIAEKKVAEELIQDDFTPETLSVELFKLLETATNKKMREELAEVKKSLGDGGASGLAAVKILNELGL